MSASFEITYAAHTSSCTFLLDSEGVCRRIVVAPSKRPLSSSKGRDTGRSAARCVGAQYVASLDPSVSGMLADMPRVGAAMLFARVDERGRVSLVRTGVVTRFERHRTEDPFVETEKAPSMSVETSAPVLAPSAPATPRVSRTALIPQDPYEDEDAIDRTQPIQALPPGAFRSLRKRPALDQPVDEDVTLDQTAEYESEGSATRTTLPSPGTDLGPPAPATLRMPTALPAPSEDDRDPYARGAAPRRSEPFMVRTRPRTAADLGRTPRPSLQLPTDKVASRGRGDR